MQIAIVLYPGLTALDAVGPYEVLRLLPDAEVRFVGADPGPVVADSGVLFLGVTHRYAETPNPAIVLVPGSGPRTATTMADQQLTDWLRRVHPTTQWTTSVCTGSRQGRDRGRCFRRVDLGLWLAGELAGRERAEMIHRRSPGSARSTSSARARGCREDGTRGCR
jgi:DJ-1/PfpI family